MAGFSRRVQRAAGANKSNGINLLIGKVFTADVVDSTAETGNPIANVTDQSESTRWISEPTSPVSMTVDIGGVYDISQLVIVFAADTIKNYAVSVSINGSTYTQVASGITNNTQKQTITISSFTASAKGRYLRITGVDRWNSSYGNSVWEVYAYGIADSAYPVGTVSNFSGTVASDSQINLSWNYSGSALTNYTLRRGSTTIASPAASATSYSDSNLAAGTSYTYTITGNFAGGGTTNTATISKTTSGGAANAGWLSGVSNAGYINQIATNFSTWRGETCTVNRFWLVGSAQNSAGYYLNLETSGWSGVLDYAIGAPPADGVSWQSAASGGYDSKWRTQMQDIHANWGSLQAIYLAPAHELNGSWYAWSVTNSTTAGYFRTAWRRFYQIVQEELVSKGRNAKVTLNYSAGRGMVEEIWPGNAYVDIVGFDIYDHWLPTANNMNCLSESDWNTLKYATTGDGSPRGPYAIQQFALSKGKPFAMPEWGLSDSTSWSDGSDPVPDNAFWIEKMHAFFAEFAPANKYSAGAGELAFESIFTSEGGDAYHLSIWPATSQNPNASAKYRSLSWGQ